ncbi:diguanylate cyclase domain-containing protein [Vibrio sp. V39_P1S14PM300]|uniref:diguanylate cyclase domain-containing protein n=1 Tax=Vibrio sp. V39_P1S14PM300 TaxID=1938690 RepID=UPI001372F5B7|nr:diguanylate cyclase [Vibrio sp. V39_P1S14PM300]NAX22367.1 diguanylate cyclase [Vibrio sp. V39_P1S14PM300]
MEQLFSGFWNLISQHGAWLAVLLASVLILTYIYTRAQKHLESLLQDSPAALLLIDASSGRLLLSNRPAMQLLGIRLVGNHYFLPADVSQHYLLSMLNQFSSRRFSDHSELWPTSSHSKVKVSLCGSKTLYRGKFVWLIYATPHCQTDEDRQQEMQSLSIANSAMNSLSELIFVKDNQGKLISANRAFERFWKGRESEGCITSDGAIKGRSSVRRWTVTPDGRSCLLETHLSLLLSPRGERIGVLGISHDVTDWHNMQKNLRDEMEKRRDTEVALAQRDTILQNILESSPDAIGIFNENMVYQACNQPFVQALGLSSVDELLGKRLDEVVPEGIHGRFKESDRQVMEEGKSLRMLDRVARTDGGYTWYDVVKSPYKDPMSGTNGVLIMARDVSERYLAEQKLAEANQELARLSFVDSLTQIANRRKFDEQLNTLWHLHVREKQPLTVMLCDIDDFKGYNDHYGHQQGDDALVEVAGAFARVLSRSSDCVARYGGEEFGFLLPNTTQEGALKVAQKIHAEIAALAIEHSDSPTSGKVTVSIGLVSYLPTPQDRPEDLIAMADSALYQAKAQGRNQTCVYHTSQH